MAIRFPLGIDRFAKLRESGSYYVDKSYFIKELLSQSFEVQLITRPRRFGKSLTMSMLADFFDISRDSGMDFEGLAISKEKELCAQWMNQWPVVFLTLKQVQGNSFQMAYDQLKAVISDFCLSHSFLENSENVSSFDRALYHRLLEKTGTEEETRNAVYYLTRILYAYYGKQVVLLIDEYDVPLVKASDNGYYKEMLDVIRALFGKSLKTNEYLKFAVITGCLKIAKESIFTGTNHFVSDTISDDRFGEYIGFTEADVRQLLADAGLADHMDEMRQWYDGYHFGRVDVYCPWDVLNHAAALQENPFSRPRNYWENTRDNGIIRQFIERRDLWIKSNIHKDFEELLQGGYIVKTIEENLTYDMLHSSADNLWSLLYLTGYLTKTERMGEEISGKLALRIPNKEIHGLIKNTVREWFEDRMSSIDKSELFGALWAREDEKCSDILSNMIFETISYNDYKEDYYHAFVVGVLSFAGYMVSSNDERGEGRPDVVLRDEMRGRAMVIEIKKADSLKAMPGRCGEALAQIENRRYVESLEDEYEEVLGYGICFYKKRCMVKSKRYRG